MTLAAASKPGVTAVATTAVLTVAKPTRTTLVNGPGNPQQGQVDGRHLFPPGSTTAGIGQYYRGLLLNAGWKEPTDFNVSGGQINFYGVSQLDGGASKQQVRVNGATDSKAVKFVTIPAKKIVKLQRLGQTQDGRITLVGFGVVVDTQSSDLTTSTSEVTIFFSADDSAEEVMQKVWQGLVSHGWTASVDGNKVEVSRNGLGAYVYSLWHSIEYDEEGENEDHWVFHDGQS